MFLTIWHKDDACQVLGEAYFYLLDKTLLNHHATVFRGDIKFIYKKLKIFRSDVDIKFQKTLDKE
jgi:hypothetical protein